MMQVKEYCTTNVREQDKEPQQNEGIRGRDSNGSPFHSVLLWDAWSKRGEQGENPKRTGGRKAWKFLSSRLTLPVSDVGDRGDGSV